MSKMFFDLQDPALAAEFRASPEAVMARYPIDARVKKEILANNVPFVAARTNPYLLRYFFFTAGMKDDEFMRQLHDG